MKERLICICHSVSQKTIEAAIARGCHTVPKISTATTACVGQCGGSCKPVVEKMLEHYLRTKQFLSEPTTTARDRRRKV